jgi:hypothetical protein
MTDTILQALFAALLVATIAIGCAGTETCNTTHSDGSSACDAPTSGNDLQGSWCSDTAWNGTPLCLDVSNANPVTGAIAYSWTSADCNEAGYLTGALEFTPTTDVTCLGGQGLQPGDLYSASVDFTGNGIRLFLSNVDGTTGRTILLTYKQ